MLRASPAGLPSRLVGVLPAALFFVSLFLFYGCSDAPLPVEPRRPAGPHALVGPTVTVTNTDDAGAGSLRQAIADAPDGATIQFSGIAGGTILLSTGELLVNKPLTIEGPVPAGMTISGGFSSRVFNVGAVGDLVLRNLSIIHGRANLGGGLVASGKLTLDHSLVANNEAVPDGGGGIYSAAAELILVNSTVSGNVASTGGGIKIDGGTVSLRNSTIADNTSENGGGIFAFVGALSLRNSIIANNVVFGGPSLDYPNCFIPGIDVLYAGRNISNDDSCGSNSPALLIDDPRLDPLANNGGPTRTHALVNGKAIDGGAQCTEATDQRYVARNQGSTCDIGAFEFNNYGTITIALNPNASVNTKTGVATVTGTIKCSASTSTELDVQMSQTQKTTGKYTTIIQAQGSASIPACGPNPSSWSATLTPATGKFETGSATGTVATSILVGPFLPSTVTGPLKVFQAK